jgi:hypothetical protein
MIHSPRYIAINYLDALEQLDGSYKKPRTGVIQWFDDEGEFHCDVGPAIIYPNGNYHWFVNGKRYLFNDWCKKLSKTDEEKMLLRLQYV